MFKFKGISSKDMQVVVEEEEQFIAKASQRYEMTEIEGRDGAIFDELGYSVVERPIYVQCLNINKIDDILAWLNGEGEFEYKGRKTTARFYSQLEPQRSSCIRIIDTTFIRDPFWCKVNEDYQLVKDRKDKKASGEYIHVEDSSNCRARIGISGNHEQETRNGKNKIEITKTTTTVNGCTHTIKDGTDTLSGTSSTNWANLIIYSFVGDGKTYTLSGSPSTSKNIFISAHDNVQKKDLATSKNGSTGTFVATSGNSIDIIICVAPNLTLANELFKPQLEEGSTATEWEQYGAMPSPDYPSKVQTVGSNVNIFDGEIEKGGINYQNGNVESATDRIRSKNFIEVDPNFQYTINRLDSNGKGLGIRGYDKDKNYVGYIGANTNKTITFIPQTYSNTDMPHPNTKFYYMKFIDLDNNLNARYKIEKGKVATPYSKYGQGCVKVTKCNKNLFPLLKSQSKENKGIIFSYNAETQEFSAKGTTTDTSFYTTVTFEELKYLSKDKKYILSISNLTPKKCMVALTKINVINNGIINPEQKQTTVDNLNKYKPDGFMFYGQNLEKGTKIDFTFKAQIEESSTETEYEQHQEQSYIMPVQKEMLQGDYFDFDNEDEVHTKAKLVLTGNENWKLESIGRFGIIKSDLSEIPAATSNGNDYLGNMCNSYKESTPSLTWKKVQGFCVDMSSCLRIYDDKYSTNNDLEGFKTYLKSKYDAGTPVMIYYKLQTPTRLAFTDEQKAVAKELNNARTYKNVTNITTDSKAILSLDYFTVTDEKIKNEGNVQSRPILRLEKTVSEAVDITINGVRFKYNFNNDKYVEIDCENKEVKFDGLERFRSIEIGYDFPKLNIGNNEITMNDGDCIIKVIRKDRWL
jgi:hypothetical protein